MKWTPFHNFTYFSLEESSQYFSSDESSQKEISVYDGGEIAVSEIRSHIITNEFEDFSLYSCHFAFQMVMSQLFYFGDMNPTPFISVINCGEYYMLGKGNFGNC